MVVAEKFQTGFDQPKLYAMYVDKMLNDLNAVQTLSRLNRIHPDKDGTFVLDFRNDENDIRNAFVPYYGKTVAIPSDPNLIYDTHDALDEFGVLRPDEIAATMRLILADKPETDRVHAMLAAPIDRFRALDNDERDRFRDAVTRFVRTYSFLSQIVPFTDTELERDYLYCRVLANLIREQGATSIDLGADIELTHLRQTKRFEGSVSIDVDRGEVAAISAGTGPHTDAELEALSQIIERFNERHAADWTEDDQVFSDQLERDMIADPDVQLRAGANSLQDFAVEFDSRFVAAIARRFERNQAHNPELVGRLLDDDELRADLQAVSRPRIYGRARVARQAIGPIGDLVGADREDLYLEYKSTLRWDIRAQSKKTKIPEKGVVKTIAGFLNSPFGGTLLIGVADDGTIRGLEDDYKTFSKRGERGDHDLFGQHLQTLLISKLGDAATAIVNWDFHSIDGADICRVAVEFSDFPVFEGAGDDDRTFWMRYPTGTKAVTDVTEQQRIIAGRFGA